MRITKQMINTNPVKAAVELAKNQSDSIPTDPELARKRLTEQQREMLRLEDLRSELLPIEQDAIKKLDKKLVVLQMQVNALTAAIVPSPATMPVFDLTCLTWRDSKGFPRLVPFPLNAQVIKFRLKQTQRSSYDRRFGEFRRRRDRSVFSIEPSLPSDLKACYSDVAATLKKLKQEGKSIEIATQFSEAIPSHIRDLIRGAREVFQRMYIVAEVSDWKVTHRREPQPTPTVNGDPLLIGWDGKHYRLIAAFDTTSLEQLAAERSRGRKPS